jgi:hypothetical protein
MATFYLLISSDMLFSGKERARGWAEQQHGGHHVGTFNIKCFL